jgi:hypothetical protein
MLQLVNTEIQVVVSVEGQHQKGQPKMEGGQQLAENEIEMGY